MNLSPTQLMAPLVTLLVASVVLAIAGVFAWGAAAEVTSQDWLPTFGAAFVAGFILVGTLYCVQGLRERTSRPYHVRSPQVVVGAAACLLLAGFALLSAAQVGNSDNYTRRFDGEPNVVNGFEDPSFEVPGFVISIVVICFPGPVSWLLYAIKRFYVDAVEEVSTEVEGPDPMGQIMKTT